MARLIRSRIWTAFFLLLVSCASAAKTEPASGPAKETPWIGKILTPSQSIERVDWIDKEKEGDVAIRRLWETEEASFQIVRLNTGERPHVHEQHDLTVFVLKGKAEMHMEEAVTEVTAGDVIEIPRGVLHWARNTAAEPSEVYAIFTPPFDGKDTHYLDARLDSG